MRRKPALYLAASAVAAVALLSAGPARDPRLRNAAREPARNGWIYVHLEGAPSQIGFQHGYLLAPEIEDSFQEARAETVHDEKHDWGFFRRAAREVFWPRIEAEYREELLGIVEGLKARGESLDIWDIVAYNAWTEFPYYDQWLDGAPKRALAERCSAFVATGSYTKDGRVVVGHNNWSSYSSGVRWNIVFDIVPRRGYRILMDGMAGMIHSGDDFGMNSDGIVITETTISGFKGFNPKGIPEFVRARKAMQHAGSIAEFARIMKEGNNGGYANNWLVADTRTNEIASLELGLKNVILQTSGNGYFVGSNFPADARLTEQETTFNVNDRSLGPNARHARWIDLMEKNKGSIDLETGQRFLADHFDSFEGTEAPSERTLCGHIDLSPRGSTSWPAGSPAGAVQNKVTDAASVARMSFTAALGHSCGLDFKAAPTLASHPEFAWMKDILRDMDARPWTRFTAR